MKRGLLICLIIMIAIGMAWVSRGLVPVSRSIVSAAGTDYSCDGVADDVQWNAALAAIPAGGGEVKGYGGNFALAATITRALDNVTITGVGRSSYLALDGVNPVITAGGNNWVIKDLRTDAGGIQMGATTGWVWINVTIGVTYYPFYTSAGQLTSSVATGTAPFSVSSNTVNTNLNADLWDGYNTNQVTLGTANITTLNTATGRAYYVIAASDAPATLKAQADIVCDGTNDEDDLNIYASAANTVFMATAGTFYCSDNVVMADNVTWIGAGKRQTKVNFAAGANASIRVWDVSDVTLRDFTVSGNCTTGTEGGNIYLRAAAEDVERVNITGIRCEARSANGVAFIVYNGYDIHHVQVKDSEFMDLDGYSTAMPGADSYGPVTEYTDFLFQNLYSYRAGYNSTRVNAWVGAFSIDGASSNTTFKDIAYMDCKAEEAWGAGFYQEPNSIKNNVTYTRCVSRNNNQRASDSKAFTIQGPGTSILTDCVAEGGYNNLFVDLCDNVTSVITVNNFKGTGATEDAINSYSTTAGLLVTNGGEISGYGDQGICSYGRITMLSPMRITKSTVSTTTNGNVIGANGYNADNSTVNMIVNVTDYYALYVQRSQNVDVTGLYSSTNATGRGIYLYYTHGTKIHNALIKGTNSYGLLIASSDNSTIMDNLFDGGTTAIYGQSGNHTSIINNRYKSISVPIDINRAAMDWTFIANDDWFGCTSNITSGADLNTHIRDVRAKDGNLYTES